MGGIRERRETRKEKEREKRVSRVEGGGETGLRQRMGPEPAGYRKRNSAKRIALRGKRDGRLDPKTKSPRKILHLPGEGKGPVT